jgi:predicted nucleic acid-binding protein
MSLKKRRRKDRPEAYFLDANILMYAAGSNHLLRDPCRGALERAVSERATLITDSEVLQEILYRYVSIRRPEAANVVYHSAVRLCTEVLPVAESHTARALELLLNYPGISPRDAIHIATMEGAGIRQILSTDTDFDGFKEVSRIDPADFLT